jgi:hypothetical protein
MKKAIATAAAASLAIIFPLECRAFTDGPILLQILSQNIKQLMELEKVVSTGNDSLELAREVNRGINDSLKMIRTIGPGADPGLYGELASQAEVSSRLTQLFGAAASSPDQKAQTSVDQSVSEAIAMNNAIFAYAKQIDEIGEEIKTYSHATSPGGAQKLTAQSLGVMIHVLSQSLRAQGEALKLQAQGLAASNKREKDYSAEYLKSSATLSSALKASSPAFEAPRF